MRRNMIGQIYEPYQVRFLERDVRPLNPNEVLVKVRASAICGSDLHIARGLHPSVPLPATIGHEFASAMHAATESMDTASTSVLPIETATEQWLIMLL